METKSGEHFKLRIGASLTHFLVCFMQCCFCQCMDSVMYTPPSPSKPPAWLLGNQTPKSANADVHNHLAHVSAQDVFFQDEHVCILHPNAHRGLVIYHKMNHPEYVEKISREGLSIYAGVNDKLRTVFHGCNFFRAPAYNHGPQPSHPTLQMVNANYAPTIKPNDIDTHFCIRIDPDHTFVYYSEAREKWFGTDKWKGTKKSLREFQAIVPANTQKTGQWYHL